MYHHDYIITLIRIHSITARNNRTEIDTIPMSNQKFLEQSSFSKKALRKFKVIHQDFNRIFLLFSFVKYVHSWFWLVEHDWYFCGTCDQIKHESKKAKRWFNTVNMKKWAGAATLYGQLMNQSNSSIPATTEMQYAATIRSQQLYYQMQALHSKDTNINWHCTIWAYISSLSQSWSRSKT